MHILFNSNYITCIKTISYFNNFLNNFNDFRVKFSNLCSPSIVPSITNNSNNMINNILII